MSGAAIPVFAFLLGAVLGSFGNVLIWRLPRGESVAWPGSHCPACDAPIRWFDNIPLASWLALRGRCRACRAPISRRYPLVEGLCGALFLAVALRFGAGAHAFVLALLCWALVVVTFIDLDHLIIPDAVTFPGMAAGLAASFLSGGPGWRSSLLGLALGYGLLFSIAWSYQKLRGREGMGMGDFKLLGMIGAVLGAGALPVTVLAASLTGSLAGLAAMAVSRRGLSLAIPFGPFLSLGALVHLFFGRQIIAWYLALGRGG
jgi:leader peptidase (prepilin peptidase) / N-methyltransferase